MNYLFHIIILICIFSILSISMNLILGVTGLLNLGHIAFFGIGAYTSALLSLQGIPFLPSLLAGSVLAGFIAYLIGIPTLRLKGDYLAIATLGLSETLKSVLINWVGLARGPQGLPGIPKPSIFSIEFSSLKAYLVLVLIFFFFSFIIMEILVRSPYGRVLEGIREDEVASQAMGKDTFRFKLNVLWFGSFFAGLAGCLYAHYMSFIDPSCISINQTIVILLMVILGGVRSNLGAVLGAVIIICIPEVLRFWNLPGHVTGALKQIIFSVTLILLMLFREEGILGGRKSKIKRFEETDNVIND
jgi:branched-chain amino acid transport system permease protein